MIANLNTLRDSADDENAELIIAGDFNESWSKGGSFKKWVAEESRMTSILRERVKEQEATKHANSWSDIDCVLCSDGLLGEGAVVANRCCHSPIFISIDSASTGWERKTCKDFEKNLVNSKESDPEIRFYKKKVIEEWQKERVQELTEEAKCETGKNKKLEIQ